MAGYRLEMSDGVSDETLRYDEAPTADECEDACREWAEGGDWGQDGAEVGVRWTLYAEADGANEDAEDEEVDTGHVAVEIEPDHAALIRGACGPRYDPRRERSCGDDPDDHDWTSEGEGGLRENPGVWSVGGTAMLFASHCRQCGLKRRYRSTGPQCNPGEHDTTKYEMPDDWCAECQSEECCGHDDNEADEDE